MSQRSEVPKPSEKYWIDETAIGNYNFDASDICDFGQQEQLQFHSTEYDSKHFNISHSEYPNVLNTPQQIFQEGFSSATCPQISPVTNDEVDEPPLMEELGIDLNRIIEKIIAVLNPFYSSGSSGDVNFLLHDTDLAGPLAFCIAMGACILLSGGKAHFGYVYGLAVTSCIVMYVLLNLMTMSNKITLASVASVLGYCLLPVVLLSALGVFISMRNTVGLTSALTAVVCCSESSSRLFVLILGDTCQRPLVAYPCALLYAVFTLIAIF